MISIPSLAGIPASLSCGDRDQLAAQAALAMADAGPIARVRTRNEPIELALLQQQCRAALREAARGLEIFRPQLAVVLGGTPAECECAKGSETACTVQLGSAGDIIGSRWNLQPRFEPIERRAPGLASTALHQLQEAETHGARIFTPHRAIGDAEWAWWRGESNESELLEEMRDESEPSEDGKPLTDDQLCAEHDVIRRADVDRALPPFVQNPARALKTPQLERLANGRGPHRELARRILELHFECRALARQKDRPTLHTWQDEAVAIGYGATLRWNDDDPMLRIFDDFANQLYNDAGRTVEAWGWFVLPTPANLRGLFHHLEARFSVARRQERVLELIATRSR